MKNYLGPKIGFYFAWMNFYTSWLLIPAIFGLASTIYQILSESINPTYSAIYVAVVMIFLSFIIEKWKRKASEISLKWGLSDDTDNKKIRQQFHGDHYLNLETRTIDMRIKNWV